MNESTKKILKKQCEMVGADFNKIDFKKPDWFLEYSWTMEKENEFKEWLIKELKDNTTRTEISNFPNLKSLYYRKKTADEFIFNHGWKIKL